MAFRPGAASRSLVSFWACAAYFSIFVLLAGFRDEVCLLLTSRCTLGDGKAGQFGLLPMFWPCLVRESFSNEHIEEAAQMFRWTCS